MSFRIFPVVAAVVGLLALSTPALAQNSANTSATGSVTIIRPITITKTADLQFGRIVKPATGSASVTIANTADSVSAGTAVSLGGTISRAKFTIDGEGGQAISVSVGSLTMNGPSASTLVVALTPDQVTGVQLSNALGAAGSLTLNVGGSFPLPAAATTGLYSGTFTVTVAYQ